MSALGVFRLQVTASEPRCELDRSAVTCWPKKNDPIFQQPAIDIVNAFVATGVIHDIGYEGHATNSADELIGLVFLGPSWRRAARVRELKTRWTNCRRQRWLKGRYQHLFDCFVRTMSDPVSWRRDYSSSSSVIVIIPFLDRCNLIDEPVFHCLLGGQEEVTIDILFQSVATVLLPV